MGSEMSIRDKEQRVQSKAEMMLMQQKARAKAKENTLSTPGCRKLHLEAREMRQRVAAKVQEAVMSQRVQSKAEMLLMQHKARAKTKENEFSGP